MTKFVNKQKNKISFIIPSFDEEENIPVLYSKLLGVIKKLDISYQLCFVNDGSVDSTADAVRKLKKSDENILLINFSRNFGYESAVKAGIDLVDGDFIVIIDADLQDPPEVIEKLYKTIQAGYDVVLAKRSSRQDSFLKNSSAWFFYRLINLFSSVDVPKDVGYFRIFSKQVLEEVRNFWEYSLFLKGIFSYVWFKVGIVEYDRKKREQWSTKFSALKLIKLGFRGILSFSTVPLQWITVIGVICALSAFWVGAGQVLLKLFHPENYQYWISTIVVFIAFISGIQMVCLWVLWAYIWKIYEETKKRPLYVIKSVE